MDKIAIFWHRRDLRLQDNAGLFAALKSGHPVLPIFIFDRHILDDLQDKDDARITFIHDQLQSIHNSLAEQWGSTILVKYGHPEQIWASLIEEFDIAAVFTNRDYEPYARDRDQKIENLLKQNGISFHTYKDHVVFEKGEIVKKDGNPYTVFTPFSKRWKARLIELMDHPEMDEEVGAARNYDCASLGSAFIQRPPYDLPGLEEMGFVRSQLAIPTKLVKRGVIRNYDKTRNFPGISGTSKLGIHFRFGTISIREKVRYAINLNETYLNELIWRDFYIMIMAFFPHVINKAFRSKYELIPWQNDVEMFEKWCQGKTGYPIVDAGMRELNQTGYMHNRVRMITASFLTKHLLIDWRWGEAYFARKLLDFELASNNGGWQWAAGTGTDAAPYFRIFNPYTQQENFDADLTYTKKWVPEYGTSAYPEAIVDHKWARARCLEAYKKGLALAEQQIVKP